MSLSSVMEMATPFGKRRRMRRRQEVEQRRTVYKRSCGIRSALHGSFSIKVRLSDCLTTTPK
jgi:hypothetical protein